MSYISFGLKHSPRVSPLLPSGKPEGGLLLRSNLFEVVFGKTRELTGSAAKRAVDGGFTRFRDSPPSMKPSSTARRTWQTQAASRACVDRQARTHASSHAHEQTGWLRIRDASKLTSTRSRQANSISPPEAPRKPPAGRRLFQHRRSRRRRPPQAPARRPPLPRLRSPPTSKTSSSGTGASRSAPTTSPISTPSKPPRRDAASTGTREDSR